MSANHALDVVLTLAGSALLSLKSSASTFISFSLGNPEAKPNILTCARKVLRQSDQSFSSPEKD